MNKKFSLIILVSILAIGLLLTGCGSKPPASNNSGGEQAKQKEQVVNLFTTRHYDTDQLLFDLFSEQTGIKVNVVSAGADELIERIALEGADTVADLLITVDAGNLHKAKERGLLQPVSSSILHDNIPENLRDKDNQWVGLTKRARVIVYSPDRVNPSELSTYEDLTNPKWKGRLIVRTSGQVYNQSLLASFIAIHGEEKAREWAKGIVANMARDPQGNDRAQATAVVAGEADVTIMNTYYLGHMLNSANLEEQKVARNVGIFFPNQNGAEAGTHINVSGIGLTKHAKNKENAIKLMEFLSSEKAQKIFADANFEFPANPAVQPNNWLKSLGEFKAQDINLSVLGENNSAAVKIFNEVGWK
ncbi:MAG: Fe(3+) ABC transporter substrate-binding protein [Clostridia bacterium]|nr:Fe(3+) ABC transporter substrate-binding protein [Clostridia bacterium]